MKDCTFESELQRCGLQNLPLQANLKDSELYDVCFPDYGNEKLRSRDFLDLSYWLQQAKRRWEKREVKRKAVLPVAHSPLFMAQLNDTVLLPAVNRQEEATGNFACTLHSLAWGLSADVPDNLLVPYFR